jgi:hypothetical protein
MTPLSRAANNLTEGTALSPCRKQEAMCIYLLEHGAIPANEKTANKFLYEANSSPLYHAVYAGNKRIVHLLLEKYHVRPCLTVMLLVQEFKAVIS